QRNQLVGAADDRRRDRGWQGKWGTRRRGGTARRTGGDQQRQEEEGQPEAACRAVHAAILLLICVSVNARSLPGTSRGWRYNSAALAMRTFLGVVELVLALLVMLGVLLQTPKANGLGGTIGGGGDDGRGYRHTT